MNWKSLKLIVERELDETDVLIRQGDENAVPSYTVARWLPHRHAFQRYFEDSSTPYPLSFMDDKTYYINLKEILF